MKTRIWAKIVGTCRPRSARVLLTSVVLGVVLTGCGGGGGGSDSSPDTGPIIVGTGITDRTLARNVLDVKAGSGEKSTTPIAGNGAFSGEIEGSGPYLSRIDLGNGEFLYGIGFSDADGDVQQNVHSYSDLIIRNWFASENRNIDSDFESGAAITLPTQAEIDAITQKIVSIVALVMEDYNVGGADLLGGASTNNVNTFIIQNPVIINNNSVTIVINEGGDDGTQSIATDNLDLGTDLGAADTESPTSPTNVRAIGASETEVVIVWTPSTDNVGVASYRVFRDGVDIGESPYPVFTDNNIVTSVTPLYTVVAVDSSGNLSVASDEVAGMALGTPDTTAPPTPTSVSLSPSLESMEVTWQQTEIDDVAGFQVLGAEEDQPVALLATVTSTFMIDTAVASGTSYCYQVIAVDASGNASDPTALQCQTTSGTVVNPVEPPSENTDKVQLAFSAASYSVTEGTPSVQLSVERVGTSTSAISVNYTVTGDTATDGEDFTATSGTLQWAAGDNTDKTITIQIASDTDSTEGNETFTVSLSEASSNAELGQVAVATVTIADVVAEICDTVLENTSITENTTLNLSCYLVNDNIDVRQPARLTIAAGTTLKFASGKELIVREGGSLSAIGTAANPIVFTAQDPTPGFWRGVYFFFSNSSGNRIEHATIEYGGGGSPNANLRMSDGRVAVSNVTLRNSEGYGFNIDEGSTVTEFSNVTSVSNMIAGIVSAETAGSLEPSGDYTGNEEDVIEVSAQALDVDGEWANLGVPYRADGIDVRAKLTIAAGTEVEFVSGTNLIVRAEGQLVTAGTASDNVLLTGKEKTPGSWDGVYFFFATGAVSTLDHTVIEYGGAGTGEANIHTAGESRFSANNVTLRDGSGFGFNLPNDPAIQSFNNVISTGNETAGRISVNSAGLLGSDLTLTGNTVDRVLLSSTVVTDSQTWPLIDVPYFHDGIDIRAALTLTAGTTILAAADSQIIVRAGGSLRAEGTAEEKIVFTADVLLKGYWAGINYFFGNSVNNVLDHTVVEYGGFGTDGGNLYGTCGTSAIPTVTVSNTQIENSGSFGINAPAACNFILGDNVTFSGNVSGDTNE